MSTAGTKMVTCSLEAEVPAVESRSGRRWGRVLKARAILRLAGAAGRGRRLLLAVTASVRLLAAPLPLSAYSNASAAWTLALSALDAGTSAHFFFSHPISVGTARQTPCGGRFNSSLDCADDVLMVPIWECWANSADRPNILRQCLGLRLESVHAQFTAWAAPADVAEAALMLHTNGLWTKELRVSGVNWPRDVILPHMPQLRALSFTHSFLDSLQSDCFISVLNLERLSLPQNNLKILPVGISYLKNLKYLDISKNPISFENDSLNKELHTLSMIEVLILSGTYVNELKTIRLLDQTKQMYPAFFLSQLDVSNCNISQIREDEVTIFSQQYKLSVVNMSHNNLKFIPHELFAVLKNLKILDLSHNYISKVPIFYFEATQLAILDLSWNKLPSPGVIIKGNIIALNMSHNEIKRWEYIMLSPFENVSILSHLNLSYNFIETFSKSMLQGFSLLQSLDLGKNPLNCEECKMEVLRKWMMTEKATYLYNIGTSSELKCSFPTHDFGQSVFNVTTNRDVCKNTRRVTAVIVVIALSSTALSALLIILLLCCCGKRYEIIYALHLLKVKKKWKISARKEHDYDWGLWQLEQASRQTRRHQRLVLLERERLARAAAPQHVRFLMDTRTYLPWTGSLARAGALERLAAALAPFPLSHAGARCHVAFARR
ncbi:Chaoptin [Gryllus bimaculatus]|nr:Chaoptin [Gryllus bimaculatus]